MSDNGHVEHVIIRAPAAQATMPMARVEMPPTPEEIIQFQAAHIREIEVELEKRTEASSTIANVACCLIDRLRDLGHASPDGSVLVTREAEGRLRGTQLTVSQTANNDVLVQMREVEKPAPIAYEDRRDDG